jgi:dihydrodipicolinate synthase/N-acetylneuraminate lyase
MPTPERLRGVIPAIPTPFTEDGLEVDETALRRIVRHCLDGGVHGIMTTGGTGEFPHLSREERARVAEVVASEVAGSVPVYAGTAACSTWEAIALAEDAARAGADAAILTPPFYFPIPRDMLYEHFSAVAAAGVLPVVVYNNPLYTGNDLDPALIAALMELDGVIGLKQSSSDLGALVEALRLAAGTGRSLCTGIDSQFYAALCVGARGIWSTAAAIVPAQMVRLYDLAQAGDHQGALAQHELLQPLNRFLEYDPGYVSPTKEALTMMGISAGPVRRPLPDFPDAERPALRDALVALGALDAAIAR